MNSNFFVGKYYQMDPDTEDLIKLTELQDGMVILVEAPIQREDSQTITLDSERNLRLLKYNRWCEVSKLAIRYTGEAHRAHFIGIYADGTKISHVFSGDTCFYVKLDSRPKGSITE